jgi:hypothetical protein
MVAALNISELSLSFDAEKDIDRDYEKGHKVHIRKAGQFFELPGKGNEQLIPACSQWVLSINDVAMQVKPEDFPVRGWLLLASTILLGGMATLSSLVFSAGNGALNSADAIALTGAAICLTFAIFFLYLIFSQPVSRPVLLNRKTGKVAQMQERRRLVVADWSNLRPFVELIYTAQAMPIWRFHLIETDENNNVVNKFLLKILAPGPSGCACYYEYLLRYMKAQWNGLPDTLLVHGVRRSLLRQFRNDFAWMFGKKRSWSERPVWLKALTFVLLPVFSVVSWPFGFFILLGSRFGWIPRFPAEVEEKARGGVMPSELAPRIHEEPPLAVTERLLYSAIILLSTVVWGGLVFHFLKLLYLSQQHRVML